MSGLQVKSDAGARNPTTSSIQYEELVVMRWTGGIRHIILGAGRQCGDLLAYWALPGRLVCVFSIAI